MSEDSGVTDPTPKPEAAPTIFGRPMAKCDDGWSSHPTELGPSVEIRFIPSGWRWAIWGVVSGNEQTPSDAARAIESRLKELVLALVPMLDEDTKREVVVACGFRIVQLKRPDNGASLDVAAVERSGRAPGKDK